MHTVDQGLRDEPANDRYVKWEKWWWEAVEQVSRQVKFWKWKMTLCCWQYIFFLFFPRLVFRRFVVTLLQLGVEFIPQFAVNVQHARQVVDDSFVLEFLTGRWRALAAAAYSSRPPVGHGEWPAGKGENKKKMWSSSLLSSFCMKANIKHTRKDDHKTLEAKMKPLEKTAGLCSAVIVRNRLTAASLADRPLRGWRLFSPLPSHSQKVGIAFYRPTLGAHWRNKSAVIAAAS